MAPRAEPDLAVEAAGLTRYFGAKRAVGGLDLRVPRGSVFALLGRNGSGKTTAIRMLLGLLEPTRGSSRVLGHDCRRIPPDARGRIGYLAETRPLYGWMRVEELARFQARFHPRWSRRVFDAVAWHFRLDPGTRARDLSRGERAGLGLALALAPDPELLVLDDPVAGLDPVARRALLEALVELAAAGGRTVFLSTHLLSDVERLADWIAVLDGSVLRAHCALETFRERVRRFVLRFDGPGPPPAHPRIPGLLEALRASSELRLTVANTTGETAEALQRLGAASVEEVPMSIEDGLLSFLGARGERTLLLGAGDPSSTEAAS
ncbi:MAG: ABC transporter ATP-binding protein [Planctomycetes bacterium]|nr:ABC transporter ATP-binding protein [Planctomycetota bacterium]